MYNNGTVNRPLGIYVILTNRVLKNVSIPKVNPGARLGAGTQQCDGFNRLMGFRPLIIFYIVS